MGSTLSFIEWNIELADDAGEMEWIRNCAHEIKVIVTQFLSSAIGLTLCTRDK
jgi:hypothetical protein